MGRRGLGQPSKLTEETKTALFQGIQAGLSYELACQSAGITYSTLRLWVIHAENLQDGTYSKEDAEKPLFKGPNHPYLDFFREFKKAEADGAKRLITLINRSANEGQWQAAAWILERRHSETYARPAAVIVQTGKTEEERRVEENTNSFLAGVQTLKNMQAEDLSE